MIPVGSSGKKAALPFSLVNTSTGLGTTAKVWNNVGGGLTDELKVWFPSTGAYGNATIARIVEIAGGNYQYEPIATETSTEGVVYYYPNVAGHDGDALNAKWERIASEGVIESGTAQAGAATSITLRAAANANNGRFKNAAILITSGTGAGQLRTITGYTGATKVADVDEAWATNPDATSTYAIFVGDSPYAAGRAALELVNVEGAYKLGDLIRLLVGVLVGKASNFTTDTVAYRNLADTKTRVTETYDDTGRLTVTPGDLTP